MNGKVKYKTCQNKETAMIVAEETETPRKPIPFVSPEEAERIFSSQRVMSLEEGWRQVDNSLGRLKDSE